MKKYILYLLVFVLLIFTGCGDNNEGPFEFKKEEGKFVLYSGNKPAKGWVEHYTTDYGKRKFVEIEYKKGKPTGHFKFYNFDAFVMMDLDFKTNEKNIKGSAKFPLNENGEIKGEFSKESNEIEGFFDEIMFVLARRPGESRFGVGEYFIEALRKNAINADFNLPGYYIGKIKNGLKEGYWEEKDINGSYLEKVNYKNGERDGISEVFNYTDETTSKKTYKNGKLDGMFGIYYKNGQLAEKATYKDGKLDGISESYYEDGRLSKKMTPNKYGHVSETYYENGQLKSKESYKDWRLDGISEFYNIDGQLEKKESYKSGILNGISEIYYSSGQLKERHNYKDGMEESFESYSEKGELKWKENVIYKDGNKSSIIEIYNENKQLKKKERWEYRTSGDIDRYSEVYSYYDDGQLWIKSNYKNRILNGIYEEYDRDGKLLERIDYKNGIPYGMD